MRPLRSAAAFCLSLLVLALGTAVTSSATAADASSDSGARRWAESSGMAIPGTRLAWGGQASLDADLDRVAATGVKWLRFDVPWSQISWKPGQADWARFDAIVDGARARGLEPVGIVGTMANYAKPAGSGILYGPRTATERRAFATFAGQAASRYKGKVAYWEVWNEPNLDQAWAPKPSPTDYLALLRVTTPAIKTANPSATVITGGTGGSTGAPDITQVDWYRSIYAAAPTGLFDAVGVHPYSDFRSGWGGDMSTIPTIRRIMDDAGYATTAIWGTEVGFTTGGSHAVSETDAARMMGEAVQAWRAIPNTGPLFWYTIQDNPKEPSESYFGMHRTDGTAKPSRAALVAMNAESYTPRAASTPTVTVDKAVLTVQSGLATGAFTLTTQGRLPVRMVLIAVRDAQGRNLDVLAARDTVLSGTRTFTGRRAAYPAGTYTYGVAYQTLDGTWHGTGPENRLTVGTAPNALVATTAELVTGPTGTTASFTTAVDGRIPVTAVILAVRDAQGRNWDVWGAPVTALTGIQRHAGTKQQLPPGTYTYEVAYLTTDGRWLGAGSSRTLEVR